MTKSPTADQLPSPGPSNSVDRDGLASIPRDTGTWQVLDTMLGANMHRQLLMSKRQALIIELGAIEDYLGLERSITPKRKRAA